MKKYKYCIIVFFNVLFVFILIIFKFLFVYYEKMMNVVIDFICSFWKFFNDDKNYFCFDILRKLLYKLYWDYKYGV